MADWVHCNACYELPGSGTHFYMTNCGHVVCQKCIDSGQGQTVNLDNCVACKSRCKTVLLTAKLKPDVQPFFANPIDVVKKNLLTALEFQKTQRQKLTTHNTKKMMFLEALAKKLASENDILKQENRELKSQLSRSMDVTNQENLFNNRRESDQTLNRFPSDTLMSRDNTSSISIGGRGGGITCDGRMTDGRLYTNNGNSSGGAGVMPVWSSKNASSDTNNVYGKNYTSDQNGSLGLTQPLAAMHLRSGNTPTAPTSTCRQFQLLPRYLTPSSDSFGLSGVPNDHGAPCGPGYTRRTDHQTNPHGQLQFGQNDQSTTRMEPNQSRTNGQPNLGPAHPGGMGQTNDANVHANFSQTPIGGMNLSNVSGQSQVAPNQIEPVGPSQHLSNGHLHNGSTGQICIHRPGFHPYLDIRGEGGGVGGSGGHQELYRRGTLTGAGSSSNCQTLGSVISASSQMSTPGLPTPGPMRISIRTPPVNGTIGIIPHYPPKYRRTPTSSGSDQNISLGPSTQSTDRSSGYAQSSNHSAGLDERYASQSLSDPSHKRSTNVTPTRPFQIQLPPTHVHGSYGVRRTESPMETAVQHKNGGPSN